MTNYGHLTAIRTDPVGTSTIIVDGAEHAEIVAAHAAATVYAMDGSRGYLRDGSPDPELATVEGRNVIVILRGDPGSDLDLYTAATDLAEACAVEGAESVRFARLPGGRNATIGNLLHSRTEERRTAYLDRLIKAAKPKPADAKPRPAKQRKANNLTATPERGMVIVNGDRYEVIEKLTAALLARWNAERLFCFGGVLGQRKDARMAPVTKDAFHGIIAETCATVVDRGDEGGGYVYAWPDGQTTGAILADAERFARLDRVSQIPFVRPDGTVCQTPGYDDATGTYLVLAPGMATIVIPDDPTPEQVAEAVSLIRDELLEGFPFASVEDLANAIAAVLTPFIRPNVPISPLGVVDGKEAGSGKNLLADIIAILATGKPAEPLPYSTDNVEQGKVITSAFRSGAVLFVFDEAHVLTGTNLARALTSHTYKDRILGVSNVAEFPNGVSWLSLGNQVQVCGDIGRRVYRIRLEYEGANPEHRPESDFKHPNLRRWAAENRHELVAACLTLIRAWFAAGKPRAEAPFRMGSFEEWQRVVGGVLANAGISGFLGNTKEWRAESDFERRHWVAHLDWLHRTFGDQPFFTADVADKLRTDRHSEPPHDMTDTSKPGYSRQLGLAYNRQKGRKLDGFQLIKAGERAGPSKVAQWRVEVVESPSASNPDKSEQDDRAWGELGGVGGSAPAPARMGGDVSVLGASASRDGRMRVSRENGSVAVPPTPPTPPDLFASTPTCQTCGWELDSAGHEANCGGPLRHPDHNPHPDERPTR